MNVTRVIVCGHTDCGGIKNLVSLVDMNRLPALSRWLDFIRPSQRDVDFSMPELSPEARHLAIVEGNVINQLSNLQSYPFIRERLETNQLERHGWVFHLETGAFSIYDQASSQFIPFEAA